MESTRPESSDESTTAANPSLEDEPSPAPEVKEEFTLPRLPTLPHHRKVVAALYSLEDAGFPVLGQHMLSVRDGDNPEQAASLDDDADAEADDDARILSDLMALARAAGRGHPMARVVLGQLWLFADRAAIPMHVWTQVDEELQRFDTSGNFVHSERDGEFPSRRPVPRPSRWQGPFAPQREFPQRELRLRDVRSAALLLTAAVEDAHGTLRALTVRAAAQSGNAVRASEAFGAQLPTSRLGTILGWTLPAGALQLPHLAARLDAYEEGLVTLTLMHLGGMNIPVFASNDAAKLVLEEVARRGHRLARLAMGYRWWSGVDGVAQDCARAAQYYFPLATEAVGDTEAQTTDRSPNPPLWSLWEDASAAAEHTRRHQTVAYLEDLAEQGDLDAVMDLAWAHYGGDPPAGIPQDLAHARQLFEQAAAHGVPGAHSALGMMHANGLGWEEDEEDDKYDDYDGTAMEGAESDARERGYGASTRGDGGGAAQQAEVDAGGNARMEGGQPGWGRRGSLPEFQASRGHAQDRSSSSDPASSSPDMVATGHEKGNAEEEDEEDRSRSIDDSLRASIRSIEDLKVLDSYELPDAEAGPSLAHALRHYRIAAEMGDGVALAALGSLFLAGEAVQKNVTAGIHLLKQGAEMGDVYAHTDLGTLYLNGEVVPRDVVLAKHHLGKAKQAGVVVAHYNSGIMHWNGWETGRPNCSAAVTDFRRVAERGSWRSDTLVSSETAFSAATGSEMDLAVRQFAVLSAMGLSAAMEDLAFLLDHKHGVSMVGPPYGSIATRPAGKDSHPWIAQWPVSETLLEQLVPFTNVPAVAAAARTTTGGLTHSEISLAARPSAPHLVTKVFFACDEECTTEDADRLRRVPWALRVGEGDISESRPSAAKESIWGPECTTCNPTASPPFLSRAAMLQWLSERRQRWLGWRRWFLAHVLYPRGAEDGVGFLVRGWGDCWRDAWPMVCAPGNRTKAAELYEQAAFQSRNGQAAFERARLLLDEPRVDERNLTSAWMWLDRAEALDYLAPAPVFAVRLQALVYWARDSSWKDKWDAGMALGSYLSTSVPGDDQALGGDENEEEEDDDDDDDENYDVLRAVESQRRFIVGPFPLARSLFVWLVWHMRAFVAGSLFLAIGSFAVLAGWGCCCNASGQRLERDGLFGRH